MIFLIKNIILYFLRNEDTSNYLSRTNFNIFYFQQMSSAIEIAETIEHGYKNHLLHLSVDCVIFGYHEHQLKVLLLKFKMNNQWALPGGFIQLHETLTGAAERILNQRTGLDKLFLQQFHTFGDPGRSQRTANEIENLSKITGARITKDN